MDLELQKRVAENIKHLRNVFGYTQAEIADELHICRSTYALYELGKKIPGTDTLVDLARFYGIHMDVLLEFNAKKYLSKTYSHDNGTKDVFQLVETYYQLSPRAQGKLIERAKILLEEEAPI